MLRTSRGGKNGRRSAKLEEIAAERIDAITAEPLHPSKYVEILSPDGFLRLFYNTSTLIRIAMEKGMFMQPPHFREPMCSELQRKVEEVEGRTFRFEARNSTIFGRGSGGGTTIQHRHVYFEQIMDQFYLLNPAELYVCPTCYLHWLSTRYIPNAIDNGLEVEYMEGNPNPLIDPLDVFEQMQRAVVPVSSDATNESGSHGAQGDGERCKGQKGPEPVSRIHQSRDIEWDTPLSYIVFRRAIHWKQHVRNIHNAAVVTAEDYRLKEFISQYISHYNHLHEERYKKSVQEFGDAAVAVPSLTVTRYWYINARFNRLRYNRVVEATERAELHICECVQRTLFENEEVINTFPSNDVDTYDDFICSSDTESDGSGYGGFPRYEGPKYSSDDEEEEEETNNNSSKKRGKKSKPRKKSAPKRQRSEKSSRGSDGAETELEKRRQLYKRGLLAPLKDAYKTLSYEERRLLDVESRRVHKPVTIYVPTRERYSDSDDDDGDEGGEGGGDGDGDDEDDNDGGDWEGDDNNQGIWVVTDGEVIDWDGIGGCIENADEYVRDIQKRSNTNGASKSTAVGEAQAENVQPNGFPTFSGAEANRNDSNAASPAAVKESTKEKGREERGHKLLLDDSE
ncbi:hypothetical protein, conserved [Trypanosoma brucei gambiense DAL972]|uniref:Uncharacterized protein n=1 Tax=Trypanosoma brucei gambiense (strain MHOM/CI/86/DAL972) TaxID=679716 RepID=C9ZTQ6_TRYB9|nr:hypothetical protein, conserved [Trypanosoma brucei gambiense DAL972]CBH12791.1 hypothetical protein, conserved [Trypanosoma brucei gambiense DAL972]|eukprot:XP_011775071.1 hypothetical protein, conserved [Trypanosoma brucei gambiense DAL972]